VILSDYNIIRLENKAYATSQQQNLSSITAVKNFMGKHVGRGSKRSAGKVWGDIWGGISPEGNCPFAADGAIAVTPHLRAHLLGC